MRIVGFEWDKNNEDKIYLKHHVTRYEAEEIFYNRPYVERGPQGRYRAFGQSDSGRYLFVVFTYKIRSADA